jgi:hypothetical protein
LRKHTIGVLQPLPLGPVDPKQEILGSLMWDIGYEIYPELCWWLTSQISHLTSSFEEKA